MKITFFGITVLLFDDGKNQILFDAHFTRPSIFDVFFGKVKTNENLIDKIIEDYKIDKLSAIFVSHSHYDHVMDAPYIANKCGATVYGSKSTLNVARGGNVSEEKLKLFKHNDTFQIGDYEIRVIKSKHSKSNILNNNLGQEIEKPIIQPAKNSLYKEGGSFDFIIKNGDKKYLIRPSFNFIEGQLDGIDADVIFLGMTGLSKVTEEIKQKFFSETLDKVHPKLVVPIHWDNFFFPISKYAKGFPFFIENTTKAIYELAKGCNKRNIGFSFQLPLTSIIF